MDKRTEFVEKLSAQMSEWGLQIDRLKDKAEITPTEAKFGYSKTAADLQLKLDQAAEKLQGISQTSDDEWEDTKAAVEQIWGEVKNLLRGSTKKPK